MAAYYEAMWKALIRPPRDVYSTEDLGPSPFRSGSITGHRTDVQVRNNRGQILQCSHFHRDAAYKSKHVSPRAEREQKQSAQVESSDPMWQHCHRHAEDDVRHRKQLQRTGSTSSCTGLDEGWQEAQASKVASEDPPPCVVYLHGNCSSRLEALAIVPDLLPLGISVFCFDFSGSGQSQGEYVTLGHHEAADVAAVVAYLKNVLKVKRIALWGRSMGAATALLYAGGGGILAPPRLKQPTGAFSCSTATPSVVRDPVERSIAKAGKGLDICGLVLDSAFSDLPALCQELARLYVPFAPPGWLVSAALSLLQVPVRGKADFDLEDVRPIDQVGKLTIPVLFVAGKNDSFIAPAHSERLFAAYGSEFEMPSTGEGSHIHKRLLMVDGHHNSERPKAVQETAAAFLQQAFVLPANRGPRRASDPVACRVPAQGPRGPVLEKRMRKDDDDAVSGSNASSGTNTPIVSARSTASTSSSQGEDCYKEKENEGKEGKEREGRERRGRSKSRSGSTTPTLSPTWTSSAEAFAKAVFCSEMQSSK